MNRAWTSFEGFAIACATFAMLGAVDAPAALQVRHEASASTPADVSSIDARVDALFAEWQRPGSPGCSGGVSRGGKTVLERGYGTAHVEHGVPITPASTFHVASVTKPFTALPAGETTTFALGLQVQRHGGRRTVGHSGGDPGTSAYVVRYPDHDLAVAVLCNLDEIDSIGLARKVADLYLGEGDVPPASSEPVKVAVPATVLAAYEGLYRDPTDETLLRIFLRDGALRGSNGVDADGGWPITPLGADRFAIPGTPITLEFATGTGGGRTLHIVGEQPTPAVLERVASYTPAAPVLAALAGDYRSDELPTTYTLRVKDGALVAVAPGRTAIALQPIRPDTFAGSLVGAIAFARDRQGRATGFTVHAYAARGIRFERLPRGATR
jgi:hypothetical protein